MAVPINYEATGGQFMSVRRCCPLMLDTDSGGLRYTARTEPRFLLISGLNIRTGAEI